ncbi:LemA family protein [Entomomonas moraniae]|uniref:LemA family protein n=1 Tax=Entomomonas moraniae TaxID=2213226 RepID=A0A3S9XCX1_9GAMM|nr:LemA family protein [Entomomonas moraniae]AZS50322.1 LemA family protein [Entomomonas moraniae]
MKFLIFLIILVGIIGFIAYLYNQLVSLKEQFKNAFSQIDIQLKRRYDLIPNLVETAKAYLKHESDTLTKVTEARNTALSALKAVTGNIDNSSAITALNQAEKQLSQALTSFNLQIEAYPELKANENIMQLSEELSSTENRIAFARQAYNDAVMAYNIQRKTFPTNLFAAKFGHFKDAVLLSFEDSSELQNAPKISF